MADDELDIQFRDLDLETASKELIHELKFSTGMMVMPPEFADYTQVQSGKRIETIDIMVMDITTVDNETQTLSLTLEDVKEITNHFIQWVNDLHEAGRCDCGEHEHG